MARRDALRQAAALRGARLRPTLEAALAELDAAIDTLTAAMDGAADGAQAEAAAETLHAERRQLRALFQEAPVALFVLEVDGTVRRVNRAAGELLHTGSGYATGRPFTAFVDLPARAAVDSQLAAVIRTGATRQLQCELLAGDGTAHCELTVGLARPRGDSDQIIVAVRETGPPARNGRNEPKTGRASNGAAASGKTAAPGNGAVAPVISAMTRRLDLMTAVARLLLHNAPLNETVVLQRCARLLADQLSTWVIVDVIRDQRLRRQSVAGGQDERAAELARVAAAHDPQPGSLAWTVHDSGSSQLIARAEDAGVLGDGPDGVPLLMLLGATSLLCVPVADGQRGYGTLTLARHASTGHFDLADLGLVEEIGEQLALAITMDRNVRRHSQNASALRDSLLPRHLPGVPGVQVATTHLAATGNADIGGDFFDVYRTCSGWGVAIGDASGRGEGVAAVSAAARYAIRVTAHSTADPAAVLTRANDIVLAEEFRGRFVTACVAHLQWRDQSLAVSLASAGHPPPLLIHPDGRVHQLKSGGLPLGIFPDAGPGVEEHELSPGDVLLFYSDGLADARAPGHGYFDDRLPGEVAALAGEAPAQLLKRLQDVVLEFCRGEIRDDITMLALRVGEPPAT
jgi:serine phosphatase RsbU (regulator of sigma subunit)/PAS domain-containing protein